MYFLSSWTCRFTDIRYFHSNPCFLNPVCTGPKINNVFSDVINHETKDTFLRIINPEILKTKSLSVSQKTKKNWIPVTSQLLLSLEEFSVISWAPVPVTIMLFQEFETRVLIMDNEKLSPRKYIPVHNNTWKVKAPKCIIISYKKEGIINIIFYTNENKIFIYVSYNLVRKKNYKMHQIKDVKNIN